MASPVPVEPRINSKKPSNSAFKQQKLPAWQPILTAGTVLPTFFIIGLAFIPVGIGLYVSSNQVQEHPIPYTDCRSSKNESVTCDELLAAGVKNCICELTFYLAEPFKKDVFVYYGLTNYYQNHRRYVKSRDDVQLLGKPQEVSTDCEPYARNEDKLPIAPCGAIANSLFNDKIKLFFWQSPNKSIEVYLRKKGIAWRTDKTVKFRNPKGYKSLEEAFNGTAKPLNWSNPVWDLSDPVWDSDNSTNGFENEDLIVWMRTAALPTFRKLYGRIDHREQNFLQGLPAGKYLLRILYRYRVTPFKGTKRIILSNTSWLGGKNSFLGIAYIVVGSICLLLAVVFLIIHLKYGKSSQDLVNISQRTPY